MKKNFINPEIKISLFDRERVRTDPTVAVGATEMPVEPPSSAVYNINAAIKWLGEKGVNDKATNIIVFKE